ncbi:MAG: hypothetical protein WAV18_06590 [Roseiarcus sp.]
MAQSTLIENTANSKVDLLILRGVVAYLLAQHVTTEDALAMEKILSSIASDLGNYRDHFQLMSQHAADRETERIRERGRMFLESVRAFYS